MEVSSLEAAAIKELSDRKKMAVKLFRPMAHQEEIFVQPRPRYMLVTGGNRGGKTISVAALTAAVAMDEAIELEDGTKIPARMPWQRGKTLNMWIMCIDQRHIGEVIYPALFKAGAFSVAIDKETRTLRAWDPNRDNKKDKHPSPPFIPARYIESISWESRSDNIFNRVTIKDPATGKILANIHAYTSKGDAPQGRAIHYLWIDEALARNGYVGELQTRLTDHRGTMVWAAWNSDEEDSDLAQFSAIIDKEQEAGSGIGKKVELYMSANEHLDQQAIDELRRILPEEEWLQRDKGIAPSTKLRMYPLFDKRYHCAIIDGADEDTISTSLRARDGLPPDDWTKTLVLDPGTQHPAVLLCAIPPPELGEYFIPYQEFYPGTMDAISLAKLLKRETIGQYFHRFIIDMRAARQTPMGFGSRVIDAYQDAFQQSGMSCATTKHKFQAGSDDVGGRQMILQGWMHPNKHGLPKLRIVTHRCPKLCEQLRKIKKDVVRKEVKDERKAPGQPHDLIDALEYFAGSHPRYFVVKPRLEDASPGFQRYMKRFGDKGNRQSFSIGANY